MTRLGTVVIVSVATVVLRNTSLVVMAAAWSCGSDRTRVHIAQLVGKIHAN